MTVTLISLLLGLFIPCIARRFAKFMPATFAYALWKIIQIKKLPSFSSDKKGKKLQQSFIWRSILFGITCALLSYVFSLKYGTNGSLFRLCFIWILLLLAEIDWRMFLLPDILTIPLLLIGLLFSCYDSAFITMQESILAAFIGYFLPIGASLLFVWKNKDAFGGGDIKLLSALGAWLGLEGLLHTIVLSCVLFIIWALIKRRKTGAYGPTLSIAAIIIAFWYF